MDLSKLVPSVDEVAAERIGKPISKGPTRLETRVAAKPLTTITDKQFRDQVWTRDKKKCRCCGRKVQRVMGRVPERGEVHHIHGRGKDFVHEVRAGILLCLTCHERCTGRVSMKVKIEPTKTFTVKGHEFTDATFPVQFKVVV